MQLQVNQISNAFLPHCAAPTRDIILLHGLFGQLSNWKSVENKFAFKHKKTKETVTIVLQHGSLLVMKDETQTHWLHRLPPTKLVTKPRVNLTFRTIVER